MVTRALRLALEDRLLAALREGPLTTGHLRELTGPHFTTYRAHHGREVWAPDSAYPFTYTWEACPGCTCTTTRDDTRSAAPRVRAALLRLERQDKVIRIRTPIPNNKGGHLWMLIADPVALPEVSPPS